MKHYCLFLLVSIIAVYLYCSSHLNFSLYPVLPHPQVLVETYYPPANAKEVDSKITLPLLHKLATVRGIYNTRSESKGGLSRIYLTFNQRCSIADINSRVELALSQAELYLPPTAHHPRIKHHGREEQAVFAVSFPLEKEAALHNFLTELDKIRGISHSSNLNEVTTKTIADYQPHVQSTSQLFESQVFSVQDAASLLHDRSFGGVIASHHKEREYLVSLYPSDPLLPLRLKGLIPHIGAQQAPVHSIHRLNGTRQHIVTIKADKGTNQIKICRQLSSHSRRFKSAYIIYNHGKELEKILRTTILTVLCGLAGVALLVLLQIGRPEREILIMLCSLPMILCTGIIVIALLGFSLNIMTLAGISVSNGLIVDAAVLFYEERNCLGTRRAVSEVREPVLISNITTLSIFVPILLLPVSIRGTLKGFLIIMSVILICGTIWTLHIFPKLCREFTVHTRIFVGFHRRMRVLLTVLRLLSMKKQRCWLIYIFLCIIPFVFIYCMQMSFHPFPYVAHQTLHMHIEFPTGTQAEYIDTLLHPYYKQVSRINQVSSLLTSTQNGRAHLSVVCTRSHYTADVLGSIHSIPLPSGVSLIVDSQSSRQKSVLIHIYGFQAGVLRKLVKQTAGFVQDRHPQLNVFYHFKDPSPIYSVCFSHQKCISAHIDPRSAAEQLHTLVSSSPSAKIGVKNQQDLILRPSINSQAYGNFVSLFRSFPLAAANRNIPISEVASLKLSTDSGPLRRSNRALYSGFSLQVPQGGIHQTIETISEELQNYPLPPGYSIDIAPGIKAEQSKRNWVCTAIGLAAVLIPLLVYAYYKNCALTLFILTFIPPALGVPLLLLEILGISLSIPVLTGFLVNVGLSINNAVVLLSAMKGNSLGEADFAYALCTKLPSLSASTFTTVAGVLPLLLGTEGSRGILSGLSIVIAGGAIASWLNLFTAGSMFSQIIVLSRKSS